jgi:hypothetical protein
MVPFRWGYASVGFLDVWFLPCMRDIHAICIRDTVIPVCLLPYGFSSVAQCCGIEDRGPSCLDVVLLLVLLFCPAWGLSMLLYMGSYPLSWAGLCWGECSPTHKMYV